MSGPAFPAGPGDDDREKAQSALARYQVVRRRVGQVAVALLACLVLFVGSAHSPALHTGIEQTGIVLIALGVGGRVWCTLYIGGRKSEIIVDQGPYSLTRNPLYLFSSVAATGVGALMGSFVAAILAGVLCALAFRIVILREEEYLRTNLGAVYADYVARVPRFFPDFRLYRDELERVFLPHMIARTFQDGAYFFLAVPFFYMLGLLQDWGYMPVLIKLW